jgi:hypothetical protein
VVNLGHVTKPGLSGELRLTFRDLRADWPGAAHLPRIQRVAEHLSQGSFYRKPAISVRKCVGFGLVDAVRQLSR